MCLPFAIWGMSSIITGSLDEDDSRRLQAQGSPVRKRSVRLVNTLSGAGASAEEGVTTALIPISQVVIGVGATLFFAYMYKRAVTGRREPFQKPPPDTMVRYLSPTAICNCCCKTNICLHAFCCPGPRAADTFSTIGAASFWPVVAAVLVHFSLSLTIMTIIQLAVSTTEGVQGISVALSIPLHAWAATLRLKLREKFSGQTQAFCPTCFLDFCCYFWCPVCSIGADAMLLDDSQNVDVSCCCKIGTADPSRGVVQVQPQVVGTPVAVATAEK